MFKTYFLSNTFLYDNVLITNGFTNGKYSGEQIIKGKLAFRFTLFDNQAEYYLESVVVTYYIIV